MAIIIEGHDNAGKSTLAIRMAEYMDLIIQESEGPPKSNKEINARVDRYETMTDRLFVRHPVISNAIYGQFRKEGDPITEGRRMIFYDAKHIIIYCDPMERGYGDHALKDHDTKEHQALLVEYQENLLKAYRIWAAQHAHFVYRIGDDMDQLISTVHFFRCYSRA